jgi:integrase
MKKTSFIRCMRDTIVRLQQQGKLRTAETYAAALSSFMRFRQNRDIPLRDVDSKLMMEYEAYLKGSGIAMNTISFYNRILRAAYNRAVERGLTTQRYPFKLVYTGIDKTVKRAILLPDIKRIKELDLSCKPSTDYARDMFMFSFYTRGMSFVDMAYLRKRDLQHDTLTYRRRKTGRQLSIRWEQCMQDIVDKYPINETDYLLPIIRTEGDELRQYRNAMRLVNNNLKEVAAMAGVHTNLTFYVSRHSWASIAKSTNVPISVISEGMGHESEATTQIYLASLDNSVIDRANEMILREL